MTDVKRLLDEATPLPWRWEDERLYGWHGEDAPPVDLVEDEPDRALVLYAVNHLPDYPDYEAAVDALERIRQRMSDWQDATQRAGVYREGDPDQQMAKWVHDEAFAVLRRLRGDVPKRQFRQMPGAPLGVIGEGRYGWMAAPDDAELLDAHLAREEDA